jgi:hypothetical protein
MSKIMTIPTTTEEITAVWLTNALRMSGTIGEETAVAAIVNEPMNGAGYAGYITRLRLTYASPTDAPDTLIAKFPNPDQSIRQMLQSGYLREVRIYQELSHQINLRTPHCYYSQSDKESGQVILLLEDLAHLRKVDIGEGCTLEDAETVINHFARFHAQWWQDPRLNDYEYLAVGKTVNPDWIKTCLEWWSQFEEKVLTLLPDCFMPASFLQLAGAMLQQQQEIFEQRFDTPLTLTHKDSHIDNLMFATSPDDPPLTVLDWQSCGSGPGASDITYFLIYSMSVRLRRQTEYQLLQTYHKTLLEQGVPSYSFAQCWRDYRLGFMRNLIISLFVISIIDLSLPHGQTFLKTMIPRLISFVEDHRVAEFLL